MDEPQPAAAPATPPTLRAAKAVDVFLWFAIAGCAALALYQLKVLDGGRSFDGSFNVGLAVWGQWLVGASLLLAAGIGWRVLQPAARGAFVFFAAVLFILRLP